jgi:hypothetical protein
MFTPDPDLDFFTLPGSRIPDPGVKRHRILGTWIRIRNYVCVIPGRIPGKEAETQSSDH